MAMCLTAFSQSVLDLRLDGTEQDKKLIQFLEEIERKQGVQFYFLDDWLAPYTIEGSYQGQTLADMLSDLLRDSNITFAVIHDRALTFIKDPSYEMSRREALSIASRRQNNVEERIVGNPELYRPGKMVTLRGRITEEESKLPLTGATVSPNAHEGTTTDTLGRYELRLPSGKHVLSIASVGFKERVIDLTLYEDGSLNMGMQEAPVLLDEVVISSQPINQLTGSRPGQLQLAVGAMKKQPALLGEGEYSR
jgi:hypothetical protein